MGDERSKSHVTDTHGGSVAGAAGKAYALSSATIIKYRLTGLNNRHYVLTVL